MMLPVGRLLLVLLAFLPGRAYVEVIRPRGVQWAALARVNGYISLRPTDRQGPYAARLRGTPAETHLPTTHVSRRQLLPRRSAHQKAPYVQEVGRLLAAASGRATPVENESPSHAWEQHLVGVWHFYLPSSLYTSSSFAVTLTPPNPLPVWVSADGSVSCPDLNFEGTIAPWRRSPLLNSQGCEISLCMASPAPAAAEVQLRGILAYSSSPTVSLWDNKIELHAAVAAGAVFVRPLEGSAAGAAGSDLPENVEIRDSSGRVVLSGSPETSSHEQGVKPTETGGSVSPKAAEHVGSFTAYRILGEDHNELRIRHPFLEYGPRRLYTQVNPDEEEAVNAFFGGSGGLVTYVNNAHLRCSFPRGRSFEVLKERLNEIASEGAC